MTANQHMDDGSAPDRDRDHAECAALTTSAFVGVPVGGGQCHTDGGPGAGDNCMVYGELTYSGMGKLHDALELQPHDCLYDLGSGIGKFVLYSALRNQCASATGVEVGLKRHASAELACSKLEDMLSQQDSERRCARFNAVLGDIRLPLYRDATAIVLCNIMFDGTLNASVVANILRTCPRIRSVASIVQLHHPRFKRRKSVQCGCTWSTGGVSWTLYTVLPAEDVRRARSYRSDIHARAEPAVPWIRPKTSCHVERWTAHRPVTSSGASTKPQEDFWKRIASTPTGCLRNRLSESREMSTTAHRFLGLRPSPRPSRLAANLDAAILTSEARNPPATGVGL